MIVRVYSPEQGGLPQPWRRPAVSIFAADVAGYSRLMGMDEEGMHERLKAHRRELVDPKIGEHSGRIVKTTGDGMLVEFPSVVDAVRCAAELQRVMIDREAGIPEDRRIRFRTRINLGDVIVEDDDIFGDGVNIAARLEALAEPGGICISGTVYDQIRDKVPLRSRIWASRVSRTSRARCGFMRCVPKASAFRRHRPHRLRQLSPSQPLHRACLS
jgi:class 3 adenylate cyclase